MTEWRAGEGKVVSESFDCTCRRFFAKLQITRLCGSQSEVVCDVDEYWILITDKSQLDVEMKNISYVHFRSNKDP